MEAFPVPAGTGCLFSDLKPHLEGKKKKTALLCGFSSTSEWWSWGGSNS
jgi:hypothetical protein